MRNHAEVTSWAREAARLESHPQAPCGGVAGGCSYCLVEGAAVVVQIVSLIDGSPTPLDHQWLVEYDPSRPGVAPDGSPMTAHIVTTPDRRQARRYDCFRSACAELSKPTGRTRPDGQPDRPLTAFTIAVERASECL